MNRYVYVQAVVVADPHRVVDNPSTLSEIVGPESISFRHYELSAESDDDAYFLGQQWGEQNPITEDPAHEFLNTAPGWFLNDYIIKLDEAVVVSPHQYRV